ncbi:MAG: YitT family protein [Clostridiales bacterium]|nr:YitT family protein [Clostridiales bacterium]
MKKIMVKLLWILVGQFFGAFAFNIILIPNKLVATGFGGVATVLNNLFGLNMQMVLIILCIPIFLWSFFFYERKQVFYAAFSYGVFTFYIGIIDRFFSPFITDPVIATVAGGFVLGVGAGIIFKQSVANGPESVVGLYFKEKKGMSVGTFFMILNTVIIASSILYGDITYIIYSLLCNLICSKVTDFVIMGTQKYYVVRVMSDRYLDITGFISKDLNRGVTFIQGMDTANVKKKMLVETVVNTQELVLLKEFIKELKDDSFVYVTQSAGLIGKGYPGE